jgi:hypothetical protein
MVQLEQAGEDLTAGEFADRVATHCFVSWKPGPSSLLQPDVVTLDQYPDLPRGQAPSLAEFEYDLVHLVRGQSLLFTSRLCDCQQSGVRLDLCGAGLRNVWSFARLCGDSSLLFGLLVSELVRQSIRGPAAMPVLLQKSLAMPNTITPPSVIAIAL